MIHHPLFYFLLLKPNSRILVAGIRNNGVCPCHRCLIKKSDLSDLGAPADSQQCVEQRIDSEDRRRELVEDARREIAENNYAVDGAKVEGLLKSQSLVPVNVGSIRIPDTSF